MARPLHTVLWILAYSSSLAALVMGLVLRSRQRTAYTASLLWGLWAQIVFASWATLIYQLGVTGRPVLSILLNAAAYLAFVLYLSTLPPVFRQDPRSRPRLRPETAARWILVGLSLGLAASNLILGLVPGAASSALRPAATAGWVVLGVLACALVGWSAWEALRDPRRLPSTRPAALLFTALFLGFFFVELVPRAGRVVRGETLYFFLPAYVVVMGVYLTLTSARLLALEPVATQTPAVDPSPAAVEDHAARVAAASGLSPREMEIARLLATGKAYKEVAYDLHISLSTVQTHVFRIYTKLDVSNKVELVHRLGRSMNI